MGILFPWNWPAEAFILPGMLLEFVLVIVAIAAVLGYLVLALTCLFPRPTAKKHEHDELDQRLKQTNAFKYAWQELASATIESGRAFAWFGVALAIVLYVAGAFMADLVAWDNHVDATIGKHYKVVDTDHIHRTVTVDEGGCYIMFNEYDYNSHLEEFIGYGEADLSRATYDWKGNLEQPCLGILRSK